MISNSIPLPFKDWEPSEDHVDLDHPGLRCHVNTALLLLPGVKLSPTPRSPPRRRTRLADRMKRSWQRLGFVSTPGRAQSVSVPFHLSFQCSRDFSTNLPVPPSDDKPFRFQWRNNQRSLAKIKLDAMREKEARLTQSIEVEYSYHTKVYGKYLATVNGAEGDLLPLELHQAVLRACAPPPDDIRAHTARLLQQEQLAEHQLTHPYESRFRKIIQNIIDAGFNPSIGDYHLIMSQFAAVGHYAGIQKYMHHMGRMGLEPNHQTFGFFLQAVAHRISLLAPNPRRPIIVRKLFTLAVQALREMVDRQIPSTPTNLDHAFRIFSEVHDPQGLAELLRLGYGVDLNYLDSPPIDAASVPSTSIFGSSPELLPFSTSALNTLLETLGRWGQISKMVYVFETLRHPLPIPAKPDNTFDDDDDDFLPIKQEWKPPSAEPNTTSFNIMIKHCIAHRNLVLARHYVTQLMHEEHMSTLRLQRELREKPLSEVAAPCMAVNIGTLRPIEGFGNRSHDIMLLKWVIRACKLSIRRKYRSWTYYDQMGSKYVVPQTSSTLAISEPSSSSSPSPAFFSKSPDPSTFDIPAHLRILKQDISALSDLKWNTENRLFRTTAGGKERLERRVHGGKDVYMEDESGRVMVDPRAWKEKKNVRVAKRKVKPKQKQKKYLGKHFDPVIANIGSKRL